MDDFFFGVGCINTPLVSSRYQPLQFRRLLAWFAHNRIARLLKRHDQQNHTLRVCKSTMSSSCARAGSWACNVAKTKSLWNIRTNIPKNDKPEDAHVAAVTGLTPCAVLLCLRQTQTHELERMMRRQCRSALAAVGKVLRLLFDLVTCEGL